MEAQGSLLRACRGPTPGRRGTVRCALSALNPDFCGSSHSGVVFLAVKFLLACPRQDSNLPVTSSLRAGSLPCELRLVVRLTVMT